jgi:hypothetical protein
MWLGLGNVPISDNYIDMASEWDEQTYQTPASGIYSAGRQQATEANDR